MEKFNVEKYKFVEVFDSSKLRYIIDKGLFVQETKDESWDPHTIMRSYLCKSKDDTINVKYKQSWYGFGRLNALDSLSLQNLPRKVRHTIAKDYYHDIDFVNAHPVFLLNYCKKNNIPHANLEIYVNNRDLFLKDLMEKLNITRDDAKKYALKVINAVKPPKFKEPPNWWIAFTEEITKTQQEIAKLNPEILEIAIKNQKLKMAKNKKHIFNPFGSCLNLLLCKIENECLMSLCDYLTSKDYKVGVLVFDGVMIRNDKAIDNKTLKLASKHIFKTIGQDVKIAVKKMDEGYEIDETELINYKTDYIPYVATTRTFDEVVDMRYISDYVSDDKHLVIKSAGGTGKTTFAIKEIKKNVQTVGFKIKNKITPFISIVSRVSLKNAHAKCFTDANIDFVDYEYMTQFQVLDENSYIITPDSLYKLQNIDVSKHILFCDELNSMLKHIGSFENMKDRRIILNTLQKMIRTCKKFIGVDADISDLVFDTLDEIGLKYHTIKNTYDPYKGLNAYEIKDMNEMYQMIKKEDSALCCFDSATEAEKVHIYLTEELGNDKVILHTAIKPTSLNNINEDWKNKIVLYSPAIIYGLDYVPIVKTPVFLFAGMSQVTTIDPLNMVQQIMRCRNISNIYYYWNSNRIVKPFERTMQDIKDYYDMRYKDAYIKLFPMDLTLDIDDDETRTSYKQMNTLFKIIHHHVIHHKIIFNTDPKTHFKQLLKDKQIKIIENEDEQVKLDKELSDELKEKLDEIKDEDYKSWIEGRKQVQKWDRVCEILLIDSKDKENKIKFKDIIVEPRTHFAFMALKKTKQELLDKQNFKLKNSDFAEILINTTSHKCSILKELEEAINIHTPFTFTLNDINQYDKRDLSKIYKEFTKVFRMKPSSYDFTTESIYKDIVKIYQQITDVVESKQIKTDWKTNTRARIYSLNEEVYNLHEALFKFRATY